MGSLEAWNAAGAVLREWLTGTPVITLGAHAAACAHTHDLLRARRAFMARHCPCLVRTLSLQTLHNLCTISALRRLCHAASNSAS